MTHRDKNISLFYTIATQRQNYNKILKLKRLFDEWLDSKVDIMVHVMVFYTNLFWFMNSCFFVEALSLVEHCVSQNVNLNLPQDVMKEEVKHVFFT